MEFMVPVMGYRLCADRIGNARHEVDGRQGFAVPRHPVSPWIGWFIIR